LETPSEKPSECKKKVFQGVSSESGDLLGAIKNFLESNEVEVYRLEVEPEVYQMKHNGLVIRFYVQRKVKEETG
jgi:hypothetical protein